MICAKQDDVILLAGKGHEPYQEIGHVRHPFDEKIVVAELLAELRSRGVRCAIVSNKPHAATLDLAEKYFSGLVDAAVGDRPGVVERKPAPDTVWAAMRELGGVPERSVYVGDSEVDIQTAQNAGIDCISVDWGFRTHEQLLGYGASCIVSDAAGLLGRLG